MKRLPYCREEKRPGGDTTCTITKKDHHYGDSAEKDKCFDIISDMQSFPVTERKVNLVENVIQLPYLYRLLIVT